MGPAWGNPEESINPTAFRSRTTARPSPVLVRLPKQAIGLLARCRSLGWLKSLRLLWATALGTIPQ